MKRRSENSYPSGSDVNFNLQLFEHALKHAPSRKLILNFLSSQEKSVFELFSKNALGDVLKTPTKKIKKVDHCESPTALLRRRELEKINRPDSAQSNYSEKSSASGTSSTLPFEKILTNVTAYVEIKSGGNDRSGGAKALLKSMGATVCDKFSRDVTHVIFKDGSYQTYQRAKLLKVHFVSVLWLEAARRNGVRPPESNYPALGTKNYDQNISLICSQMQKEYEDVIRDEIKRTLESGTSIPTTKSLINNRRKTIGSTSTMNQSNFLNEQCSSDVEVGNILQKIRNLSQSKESETSSMVLGDVSPTVSVNNDLSNLSREIQNQLNKSSSDSFRPSSLNLENNSDIWTSDSECGMIDGDFSRNEKVINETACTTPFKGNNVENSIMEITCSNESESSDSRSLLSNRYDSRKKSINKTSYMELTNLEQTKLTTVSETPRNILKHLGQNIMNSVSYLASKANVLSNKGSKTVTQDDKENHNKSSLENNDYTESDRFYQLKTPTLTNKKKVKSNIFPNAHAKSCIENFEEVNGDTSKEGFLNERGHVELCESTQKRKSGRVKRTSKEMPSPLTSSDLKRKKLSEIDKNSSTEMSSLHISSDSKSKKQSEENKSVSTEMSSLHISSDSKSKRQSEENKTVSTEMSSLHISSDSKGKKQSEENKSVSTEMSSLRISLDSRGGKKLEESKRCSTEMTSLPVSTDSKKTSNSTSMSSLKLSINNIEISGSTNESSSKMYSEDISSKEINDGQKIYSTSNKMQKENVTDVTPYNKIIEKDQLLSTPFVTERKKRKNFRKSEVNCENSNKEQIGQDNINLKFTQNDVLSPEKTSEKARRTRRESLALKKEKSSFEMELLKRKDFHDKNKEVELHFAEMNGNVNTTNSPMIDLNKTPIKSGISESHFVKTRSNRRSVRHAVDDEPIISYDKWEESNSIRRNSVRKKRESLTQDVKEKKIASDWNSAGKRQQLFNANTITKETIDKYENSENTLSKNADSSLKTPRKIVDSTTEKLNKIDTSMELVTSKKAVVVLENVLVSPQKDKTPNKKPQEKSKSETKYKTNVGINSSVLKNISEENIVLQDEGGKYKTQPQRKNNFIMSRSKSESDIKRRSRRIRKLYNPDESLNDKVVNDYEERDMIRKEKETRNKDLTQCSGVIGNVFLTQKALEYLEKNKNNLKEIKTLFHSPESVLDHLGIDKKKQTKNKKESILNRSSDEQIDLAEEFVHKKHRVISQPGKASQQTPRSRKSIRILSQKSRTAGRVNRRSTLEFASASQVMPKAKTKLKLDQKPTIVCTKMHRQDVQMFNQIVRKLGTFVAEDEVTSRTTHLVVGEVKRTINLLRALARGCWILRQEWLLKSLEYGKWLPEEDYEVTEFSPAVQKCRLEKSAFGPSYTMNIFLNCGPVYVAKSTTPRCSDLRELITICKGKITKMPDNAVISVGAYFDGCKCVSEYWILDSISYGKLKPLKKYFISKESGQSPFV